MEAEDVEDAIRRANEAEDGLCLLPALPHWLFSSPRGIDVPASENGRTESHPGISLLTVRDFYSG
jgi:hypothetical protein